MIAEIAKVLGMVYTANGPDSKHIVRVHNKLFKKDPNLVESDPDFEQKVKEASAEVDEEGNAAMRQVSDMLIKAAEPVEKVYKIKRTAKGARIKIKSATGKAYSFGPVWVDSVKAGKGIALAAANREKLEMHARHVGLNPDYLELNSVNLAKAITENL